MTQNSTLLLAGGGIALAALAVLLLSDTPTDVSVRLQERPAEEVSAGKNAEIVFSYTAPQKITDARKIHPVTKRVPAVAEKPLPLGVSVQDTSHEFEIALFDPAQTLKPSESPRAKRYAIMQGMIDGRRFSLRVPDYLMEHPETLKLRVKNRKDGSVTTAPAAGFIQAMRASAANGARTEFSIDSSDPENFAQTSVARVSPPAPR